MATRDGRGGVLPAVGRLVRRVASRANDRVVPVLGGRTRTQVIVVLACVLALSSADTATVGAAATELIKTLHITNFDIGLLVAVSSVVAAVFSLPFGVLTDRIRRTWLLGASVVLWGLAMVWSATAGNFGDLLVSRLALGGVTAVAGPAVASLVGDWFPGNERGQIYSYILTGELLGAGVGFVFTGDLAAISWRLSFVILAIPAFLIAWVVFKLPEPMRGGAGGLAPDPGTKPWEAMQRAAAHAGATTSADGAPPAVAGVALGAGAAPFGNEDPYAHLTDAQRLALERGVEPDPALVAQANPNMGFFTAVRYVLGVRTNVVLIISGVCGYYFLSGIETFGVEFAKGQYHVGQFFADALLVVVGAGAVVGVLVAGPLGDSLLRRGRLSGRINVAAIAATITVVMMIPALLTHSVLTALPYVVIAGLGLSAQNPPLDAARLDIMPSWLWGRAEGIRTFVRTGAQALAPLLFGAVSDDVFGGGSKGLRWTFVIMLLPLAASAFYLFMAGKRYPKDVATAAAAPPPRPRPAGRRRVAHTRVPSTSGHPPTRPAPSQGASAPPRGSGIPGGQGRFPGPSTAPGTEQGPGPDTRPGAGPGPGPETRWIGGSGPTRRRGPSER